MSTSTKLFLGGSLVVALAGAFVGCGMQKKAASGLSVSTHSSAPAASASATGLTLSNGIEITEIRMAVRKIAVEGDDAENVCSTATSSMSMGASRADHDGSPGDDGEDHGHHGPDMGDDGNCEFAFGPFDVDLAGSALTGKIAFAFDAPIPPGTYEEVVIDVNTVSSTIAGDNAVLQALASEHASIIVDGFVQEDTSTTQPFHFVTHFDVRQKREGKIVIGEGSNVTLDFDPTGWFTGPDGARLDPNDPNAQGMIFANIRASIRILKDDDHDGKDDDEEHGHGGGDD